MTKFKIKKITSKSNEKDMLLDYFKKIKSYAEEHTTLFIAISSAIVTIGAILVKFCFYMYYTGFYKYFGVSNENILLKDDNNILMSFLSLLVMSSVLILINLLGYINIRKRTFLKYFFILNLIVFGILCVILYGVDKEEFNLITLLAIIIASLLITFLLNGYTLSLLFSLPSKVKLQRTEILISKLKEKKINTKIELVQLRIR